MFFPVVTQRMLGKNSLLNKSKDPLEWESSSLFFSYVGRIAHTVGAPPDTGAAVRAVDTAKEPSRMDNRLDIFHF